MKIVYVVMLHYGYQEYQIVKIFSKEQKAIEYCDSKNDKDYFVEEYELE